MKYILFHIRLVFYLCAQHLLISNSATQIVFIFCLLLFQKPRQLVNITIYCFWNFKSYFLIHFKTLTTVYMYIIFYYKLNCMLSKKLSFIKTVKNNRQTLVLRTTNEINKKICDLFTFCLSTVVFKIFILRKISFFFILCLLFHSW